MRCASSGGGARRTVWLGLLGLPGRLGDRHWRQHGVGVLRESSRRRFNRGHSCKHAAKRAAPAEVAGWIQANNLLKSPPIPVESFALFSSRLGGEGASYNWADWGQGVGNPDFPDERSPTRPARR